MTIKRPRNAANFKEFSIDLADASPKEKEFSFFFLGAENKRKRALIKHFEQKFSIQFQKHETGDYIGTSIKFKCLPDKAEPALKGYMFLFDQFKKGAYINKELITQAAALAVTTPDAEDIVIPQSNNDNFKNLRPHYNNQSKGKRNKYTSAPPKARTYALAARNDAQRELMNKIDKEDVIFAVGPAGTGKTHIMVAKAVEALKNGSVKKILLARPAVTNDESLGFLPGNAKDKLDPYLRPLYDELENVLGSSQAVENFIESGIIELVPVGMMRGRTFIDYFVIVDEAQNCTKGQVKMILTRLGEGSKMGITGDPQQCDLPDPDNSGLQWAVDRLEGLKDIGVQIFAPKDVVRRELVARIIPALEDDIDKKQGLNNKKNNQNTGPG